MNRLFFDLTTKDLNITAQHFLERLPENYTDNIHLIMDICTTSGTYIWLLYRIESMAQIECFEPIVDTNCHTLILGTVPGETSLLKKEYYGSPNNYFLDIIFRVFKPNWNSFETEVDFDLYKADTIGLLRNELKKNLHTTKAIRNALRDTAHSQNVSHMRKKDGRTTTYTC